MEKNKDNKKKGARVSNGKYIRFDWAAKNILRNKADFVIFEGEADYLQRMLFGVAKARFSGRKFGRLDNNSYLCSRVW